MLIEKKTSNNSLAIDSIKKINLYDLYENIEGIHKKNICDDKVLNYKIYEVTLVSNKQMKQWEGIIIEDSLQNIIDYRIILKHTRLDDTTLYWRGDHGYRGRCSNRKYLFFYFDTLGEYSKATNIYDSYVVDVKSYIIKDGKFVSLPVDSSRINNWFIKPRPAPPHLSDNVNEDAKSKE